MKLYHGSNCIIDDCINPSISFDYEPLVYATDNLAYAIVRSGAFDMDNDDIAIKEDYDGDKITLVELKEGSFKKVFDTSGYVYVVNGMYFKKSNNGIEYVSDTKVPYEYRIFFPNVLQTLEGITDNELRLVWYKDNNEYFIENCIDKEAYLYRRNKRRKMIKNRIAW